jgi:hypothetical protein
MPLPGFENGRTVSTTDKVRMKGIVERTRLVVVKKLGERDGDEMGEYDTDADGGEDDEDTEMVEFEGFEGNETEGIDGEGDVEGEERRIARVFEKTLGELGDVLGGEPIGIITDD